MQLEAHGIYFGYGPRIVLNNVSLTLTNSQVVSLLGPNGSGKSTLLKILLGFLRPQRGDVWLDGIPIRRIPPKALARNIAYVPQSHQMAFPYRVGEIVLMGRMPHQRFWSGYSQNDRRLAREALEKLSIGHLQDRAFTEISGGERQLTLIARALAQGATTLIMDEPVSGLDYGNQIRLLERIHELAREGYSFLKSSHFPEHALLISDWAILLSDGGVLAEGRPDRVITQTHLRRLYQVEVEVMPVTAGFTACVPSFTRKGGGSCVTQ